MVKTWGRSLAATALTFGIAAAVVTCGGEVAATRGDAGDAGPTGVYCHKEFGVVDGVGDANEEYNVIVTYCSPGTICKSGCGGPTGWHCFGFPDVYLVQTDGPQCP
jgi:hypothetical protein